MSAYRPRPPRRDAAPAQRLRHLAANAGPVLDRTVGSGRGRRILDEAARRLGLAVDPAVDVSGWSAPEYLALRAAPPGSEPPPRRAGAATAALANRLAGALPTEAVVLARAITDVAPVAGRPVGATMQDILDRYLAESLLAYDAQAPAATRARSAELLMKQLQTLHEAAERVARAEAEHSSRELRIQERFLADRFREFTESRLTLPDAQRPPAGTATRRRTAPQAPPRLPPSLSGRTHLEPDRDSAVLLPPAGARRTRLLARLALPKGHPARFGAVIESASGAVTFQHVNSRRWLVARQPTGFRAPQVNLSLSIETAGLRRLLLYVASPALADPLPTTLFVRDAGDRAVTIPTLLGHEARADTTAMATAYVTTSGLVLRNESTIFAGLRSACEAYGYERVAWLDEDTPVV